MCAHCGATLESPIGREERESTRSATDVFTPHHERLRDEPSSNRDDNDIENILFDWKNPIVLNLVGSLVCTMILIATLLEL